ncbi:hypothetical protein PAXINDRAFT_133532 [Paxillus involutus ATCC 200175]|uniref:Uncharacterized protein n=1 Tax=Paxillus involutus ATCC 200175 TaxID=664439 RepID=A0A0C9U8Z2_PAXIN|nr:hypothetical protein PAXINDRAFT_133532 [Paxillus involutus ATCC 200175]
MPFGLTIGTERATSLQNAIQDELMKRGFSPDTDPVMAEYITIMIINNKTAAQITSELEDLIGSDFDPSFTDWLFTEAAKGVLESEVPPSTSPSTSTSTPSSLPSAASPKPQPQTETPTQLSSSSTEQKRPPNAPRAAGPGSVPLYQQALSSTLGSSHGHGQKRTASVRSPSPTGHGPSKTRRMDVPTGPRAMQSGVSRGNEGGAGTGAGGSGRSLLDRVGGRNGGPTSYTRGDEIQARIDAVTNGGMPPGGAGPDPSMMLGFQNGVGMGAGLDMGAANVNANTMMFQEMMMNQMALMAQMATSMGMLNPTTGQMMGGGFPGMPQGDMGIYPGGGAFGQGQGQGANGRGRGGGRGGRGRGRGGHFGSSPASPSETPMPTQTQVQAQAQPEPSVSQFSEPPAPLAAPKPTPATASQPLPAQPQRIPYAVPERPQSPTLCKFGTKCTNLQCRFSHPSPVATAESGVVLSTEACENGKDCKDKDCIKSHVSPAVNSPSAELQKPPSTHPHPHAAPSPAHPPSHPVPCRFGASCTRPNCNYTHPSRPSTTHFNQQCRFGSACTRGACPFQHPEGRVLPSSFHRGLSTSAPMVNVPTPETGSIGGAGSMHRSVTFNAPSKGAGTGAAGNVKEKLEKQIKELEATKKAVQVAEAAAAAGKKDEVKPAVPIAA